MHINLNKYCLKLNNGHFLFFEGPTAVKSKYRVIHEGFLRKRSTQPILVKANLKCKYIYRVNLNYCVWLLSWWLRYDLDRIFL